MFNAVLKVRGLVGVHIALYLPYAMNAAEKSEHAENRRSTLPEEGAGRVRGLVRRVGGGGGVVGLV